MSTIQVPAEKYSALLRVAIAASAVRHPRLWDLYGKEKMESALHLLAEEAPEMRAMIKGTGND